MAYATIVDILTRYPPSASLIGTGSGEVTSVQIASVYISDAEGFVGAYLGAKYAVPLVTEPIITSLTSDISIYKLLEDKVPRIPEFAQKRYDNALKTLEMLRDGKMVLSSSQTLIASGDQEAFSTTQSYHPVFSPVLGELQQAPDSDQITADKEERFGESGLREEYFKGGC